MNGQVTLAKLSLSIRRKIRRLYQDKILAGLPDLWPFRAAGSIENDPVSCGSWTGRGGTGERVAHRQISRHLEALLLVSGEHIPAEQPGRRDWPDGGIEAIGSKLNHTTAARSRNIPFSPSDC
jgi:ATP-dependent protease HslVU (ClpYQ) peptidase subunit